MATTVSKQPEVARRRRAKIYILSVPIMGSVCMSTRPISATEFKARCLRIIQEMHRDGCRVTITRRGCPVAVLSPLPAGPEAPPCIGRAGAVALDTGRSRVAGRRAKRLGH